MSGSVRPKYENCSVYGPNDELMFRCSRQKMAWYLKKNLAKKKSETSIELGFEPKGMGHMEQPYYLEDRENRCVVCGVRFESRTCTGLIQFHIVPMMYRKFMPQRIKDHSSHDVLTLCIRCQQKYEPFTKEKKQFFAQKYNIPVEGRPWHYNQEKKKIKSAAKALLKSRNKMPKNRVDELMQMVMYYFKVDQLSDDLLNQALTFDVLEKGEEFQEHGQVVIGSMTLEEKTDFVKEWRKLFLDSMKPRFLSPLWKVDNDVIQL